MQAVRETNGINSRIYFDQACQAKIISFLMKLLDSKLYIRESHENIWF